MGVLKDSTPTPLSSDRDRSIRESPELAIALLAVDAAYPNRLLRFPKLKRERFPIIAVGLPRPPSEKDPIEEIDEGVDCICD